MSTATLLHSHVHVRTVYAAVNVPVHVHVKLKISLCHTQHRGRTQNFSRFGAKPRVPILKNCHCRRAKDWNENFRQSFEMLRTAPPPTGCQPPLGAHSTSTSQNAPEAAAQNRRPSAQAQTTVQTVRLGQKVPTSRKRLSVHRQKTSLQTSNRRIDATIKRLFKP